MKWLLIVVTSILVSTSVLAENGRAPAVDPDVIINPSAAEQVPNAVPPQEWKFQNPMSARNVPPAGVAIGRDVRLQWAQAHAPKPTVFNFSHMALLFGILALPLALFFMIRAAFSSKEGPTWSENLSAEVFQMEGERVATEKAHQHAKDKKEKHFKKAS